MKLSSLPYLRSLACSGCLFVFFILGLMFADHAGAFEILTDINTLGTAPLTVNGVFTPSLAAQIASDGTYGVGLGNTDMTAAQMGQVFQAMGPGYTMSEDGVFTTFNAQTVYGIAGYLSDADSYNEPSSTWTNPHLSTTILNASYISSVVSSMNSNGVPNPQVSVLTRIYGTDSSGVDWVAPLNAALANPQVSGVVVESNPLAYLEAPQSSNGFNLGALAQAVLAANKKLYLLMPPGFYAPYTNYVQSYCRSYANYINLRDPRVYFVPAIYSGTTTTWFEPATGGTGDSVQAAIAYLKQQPEWDAPFSAQTFINVGFNSLPKTPTDGGLTNSYSSPAYTGPGVLGTGNQTWNQVGSNPANGAYTNGSGEAYADTIGQDYVNNQPASLVNSADGSTSVTYTNSYFPHYNNVNNGADSQNPGNANESTSTLASNLFNGFQRTGSTAANETMTFSGLSANTTYTVVVYGGNQTVAVTNSEDFDINVNGGTEYELINQSNQSGFISNAGAAPYTPIAPAAGAATSATTYEGNYIELAGTTTSAGVLAINITAEVNTAIAYKKINQIQISGLQIAAPPPAPFAPLIINAEPTSVSNQGTPYGFTYDTSGFPAPTFSVTSGALPPGLTLSSSGVISGTPTAPGTYTGIVTATSSAGSTTQNFSITIARIIDTPTLPITGLIIMGGLLLAIASRVLPERLRV